MFDPVNSSELPGFRDTGVVFAPEPISEFPLTEKNVGNIEEFRLWAET